MIRTVPGMSCSDPNGKGFTLGHKHPTIIKTACNKCMGKLDCPLTSHWKAAVPIQEAPQMLRLLPRKDGPVPRHQSRLLASPPLLGSTTSLLSRRSLRCSLPAVTTLKCHAAGPGSTTGASRVPGVLPAAQGKLIAQDRDLHPLQPHQLQSCASKQTLKRIPHHRLSLVHRDFSVFFIKTVSGNAKGGQH